MPVPNVEYRVRVFQRHPDGTSDEIRNDVITYDEWVDRRNVLAVAMGVSEGEFNGQRHYRIFDPLSNSIMTIFLEQNIY